MPRIARSAGFGLIVYAVLALAILGTLSGIAYKIREGGKESVRLEWAEANRIARAAEEKKAQAAATKTEAVRVEIRYRTKTITKEVDKIVDRPVYKSVCLDADGLRLARMAIKGEAINEKDRPKPISRESEKGLVLVLDMDWIEGRKRLRNGLVSKEMEVGTSSGLLDLQGRDTSENVRLSHLRRAYLR